MPELPEVETVARDLNKALVGKTIKSIISFDKKTFVSSLPSLRRAALGNKIIDVRRRAKMLIIDFGKHFFVVHLKMTGQLIFQSNKKLIAGGHPIVSTGTTVPNKFTRLVFTLNNGGTLYFNDIRKFGWVKAVKADEFSVIDNAYGHEPFDKALTFEKFVSLINRRLRTSIKAALLDQKLVVGLGNIYVDEVLFKSGLRPTRLVKTLTLLEKKKIYLAIPLILKKAILKRGTTFSNFRDGAGQKGNFVAFLKVYGRSGQPCKSCGELIKKIRLAGRGTHFCPNCQK
ncbi:MAG: bifunctional DNA-formamidopyrimidine glycosylase/DNA-(apurinic or apyrimidinic site) lyase [Candidatus Falkowbacteria bacterium]|nr:bifunctional DNA-formamidopyrimidine glycosylase/DNA-(apurinic or apyrimidinic site) lyase [Candidatus Falkowbacteria bacterium]